MDDAQWLFQEDSKQKKITARSARKKVRHTGCKLPTDYRSKKEIREMNGEVITMNINKPMSYRYFKTLNKEMQEEYLNHLVKTYGCNTEDVAKMLGTTKGSMQNFVFRRSLKIDWLSAAAHKKMFKGQEWEVFCNGEAVKVEVEEKKEIEPVVEEAAVEEETPAPLPDIVEAPVEELPSNTVYYSPGELVAAGLDELRVAGARTIDEVVTETPFELQTLNLTLRDIRDWESLQRALSAFSLPMHNSVTISIHAIKEE